jgi:predicted porin
LEKIEMKKTLVAVAAFAAITGAHAEVTITGVMEAAISSSGGAQSVIGGTNGSEISFGVNEDLGNGLKAIASTSIIHSLYDNISTGNLANTAIGRDGAGTAGAASVSAYNSYIGLAIADVGTVKLGQQFSPTFFASTIGDPAGRAAISNYLAGGATGQVANSITYGSPTFSGFTLAYQKVLANASTISAAEGVGYNSYSITYSNGGLNAAYSAANSSTDGTTGNLKETVSAASYDFGTFKLHAGYSTISNSTSASGYAVSVPFGAVTVSYGYSSKGSTTAQQFGGKYAFSKRTVGYVAQGISGTANTRTTIMGMRHDF